MKRVPCRETALPKDSASAGWGLMKVAREVVGVEALRS
jgi:hypothetical protein